MRLARSPAWWKAHRFDWPTPVEWLAMLLAIIILTGCTYVVHAAQVVDAAMDTLTQNERILQCLNKRGSLGTVAEHGDEWSVECSIVLRKRT